MTSKWIKEIYKEFYRLNELGDLGGVDEILDRINNLLERAMLDVDDELLFDEIRKELND